MFALFVRIFMVIILLFLEEAVRDETVLLAISFPMPIPYINTPRGEFCFFDAV